MTCYPLPITHRLVFIIWHILFFPPNAFKARRSQLKREREAMKEEAKEDADDEQEESGSSDSGDSSTSGTSGPSQKQEKAQAAQVPPAEHAILHGAMKEVVLEALDDAAQQKAAKQKTLIAKEQ